MGAWARKAGEQEMKSYRRSLATNGRTVFLLKPRPRRLLARFLSSGMVFLPLLFPANQLRASDKLEAKRANKRIQNIVNLLRHDLSIQEDVFVSVVPDNKRLVSVERCKKRRNAFMLSFDQNFLNTLDDTDLTAAIAHELGHVWIFTHHPYLQTELLANQIALKVATRESLEKVYEKVWKDTGTKGNLRDFLGEETAVGLKSELQVKSLPKVADRLTKK
jgi:hypothetical protein